MSVPRGTGLALQVRNSGPVHRVRIRTADGLPDVELFDTAARRRPLTLMALTLRPEARKELAEVPRAERERLRTRLEEIATDPYGSHPGAKRLQGTPGFSVRQGDWRAIDRITGTGDTIVIRVRHRREVYR